MVMMQSPVSDIPQPATSPGGNSSNPGSPKTNNNIGDTVSKFHKYEPIRLERPQPTKFDGILLARFQEHDDLTGDLKNRPIIYPKDEMDSSANFSIERLKQLTNHSISRLSPCEDSSNQSSKYSIDPKYENHSPIKNNPNEMASIVVNHPQFPIKYSATPSQLDIERLKLARTITNGKDLSDFGFRIQLGGLSTNYARSDTSEELVVDGNDETLSQDAAPVS